MIYENPIIFKKLVKSDSKEKFYYKNIIKSIIFRKFQIFLLKNNVFYLMKYD